MHLFLGILFFVVVIIYFFDLFLFRKVPKWISVIVIVLLSDLLIITQFMHLIILGISLFVSGLFVLKFLERPHKKQLNPN